VAASLALALGCLSSRRPGVRPTGGTHTAPELLNADVLQQRGGAEGPMRAMRAGGPPERRPGEDDRRGEAMGSEGGRPSRAEVDPAAEAEPGEHEGEGEGTGEGEEDGESGGEGGGRRAGGEGAGAGDDGEEGPVRVVDGGFGGT
jgi:hypothetical protein